jgi:hypothetical protein
LSLAEFATAHQPVTSVSDSGRPLGYTRHPSLHGVDTTESARTGHHSWVPWLHFGYTICLLQPT